MAFRRRLSSGGQQASSSSISPLEHHQSLQSSPRRQHRQSHHHHRRQSSLGQSAGSAAGQPSSSAPVMAAMPTAPMHPVPKMQGAFEESMRETMAEPDGQPEPPNPYLNADKLQRRKLLLESAKYERTVAGRWLQKPGESYHPLWKLVAQISFGMHLLQSGLAKSEEEVIKILQTHVDEIDGFLERTTEDFAAAQQDVSERIRYLRLPLEHGQVFDAMLGDRSFRTAIIEGNDKIQHIVSRTNVYMKDSLKDVQKGIESTKELAKYLEGLDRYWPNKSEEHAAIYAAMLGNTEGWTGAYKQLQQSGSELGLSLVQLDGVISEIQRRAGVASRRNLPGRSSSRYGALSPGATATPRNGSAASVPARVPAPARVPVPAPAELASPTVNSTDNTAEEPGSPKKFLPTEPSTTLAISRAAKASQPVELPAESQPYRKSMRAQLVLDGASSASHSQLSGQTSESPRKSTGADFKAEEAERINSVISDAASMAFRDPESAPDPQLGPKAESEHGKEREQAEQEAQGPPPEEEQEAAAAAAAAAAAEQQPDEEADVQATPEQFNSSPHPEGRTFFTYASSEAGSTEMSSHEKNRSRSNSQTNKAPMAPNDMSEITDDEGIVNHSHPLLQDIRARRLSDAAVGNRPTDRDLATKASAESLPSESQRSSSMNYASSAKHSKNLSDTSPFASNRDSNNTMATPISLTGGDREAASIQAALGAQPAPTRTVAPPVLTVQTPGATIPAARPQTPPSPSLAELTSATVSGPEMGDPFAPVVQMPARKPRHQELINRITNSINESSSSTNLSAIGKHSRSQSRETRESPPQQQPHQPPAPTSTTTTTTTVTSPPITYTSYSRNSVAPPPQPLPPPNAGVQFPAAAPPPQHWSNTITTTTTQYSGNGQSFPPVATVEQRADEVPTAPSPSGPPDAFVPLEAHPKRKSVFGKVFSIRRKSKKPSMSQITEPVVYR